MRRIFQILGALFCVLTALSFLGAWSPAFDSLAIFRPIFWLLAGFGTFFFNPFWQFLSRIGIIISGFPFLVMFDTSRDFDGRALRIYQHNLLYTNTAPDLQMVVDRLHPDVLTLQEIKAAMNTVENLKGYPNSVICRFASVGDVGVVTKHTIVDSGCSEGEYRGFAWARIANAEGQEVTVVSMHLYWPYPYEQPQQLAQILPELSALPRPIVIGGDFNQVLWSHAVETVSEATGAEALPGLRFTLVRPPLFLPIDQIFGNGVHNIQRLERYGSDHNALLADFQNWPI